MEVIDQYEERAALGALEHQGGHCGDRRPRVAHRWSASRKPEQLDQTRRALRIGPPQSIQVLGERIRRIVG